jgi:Tol biopolymer transport system component
MKLGRIMKKQQVAVLILLAIAAAITVGCGNSSPTFSNMPFMSNRTVDPATELFTMKFDGSNVTPVPVGDIGVWSPSASANQKTFVYVSDDEVWSTNSDGATPVQLTNNSTNDNFSDYARISPNGKKILYQVWQDSDETIHIWIMNVDGTGNLDFNASLPTGETGCYSGNFSADSAKVVLSCYSNTNETIDIFTAKTDGTQLTPVLTQSGLADTPSFTPDDKQILYVSWGTPGAQAKHAFNASRFRPSSLRSHNQRLHPYGGSPEVFGVASVNIDGSNPIMIVPNAFEAEVLNSNLYYTVENSNPDLDQIFKSNLDGTGAVSISDGTADDWLGLEFED